MLAAAGQALDRHFICKPQGMDERAPDKGPGDLGLQLLPEL